jgi:TetR/AcrR family transcriptional regulator, mexJK operon transcriptional repressor
VKRRASAKLSPESPTVSERVGTALVAVFNESRTVSKHRKIAEAATEVFIAKGYSTASVDEIALTAGVSKQTVYKHFGSKENLFLAVAAAATDAVTDELGAQLEASRVESDGLAEQLHAYAYTLARLVLRPEIMALRRLVMTELVRFPELGLTWYAHGPGRVVEQLRRRFQELSERGTLSVDDSQQAAEYFNWLVLSTPQNKILFGTVESYTDAEIDQMATAAVAFFLAACRPHQQVRQADDQKDGSATIRI